jgi:hypothetical protein
MEVHRQLARFRAPHGCHAEIYWDTGWMRRQLRQVVQLFPASKESLARQLSVELAALSDDGLIPDISGWTTLDALICSGI